MKRIKFFFTVLSAILVSATAFSQETAVSGTVTDALTGEPVPFASIQIKGTLSGGSTDAEGKYSLPVSKDAVLIFSSIGYRSEELAVEGRRSIDVALHPDSELLEETIVVAFGSTTKEAFTGSAAVVKSDQLAKRQTTDISNALVGAVPGLQLRGGSGQPGSNAGSINIRGISSMYASTSPLIIVDGAPYTASLSNIPQSDIESVSVLKDAASAALYGARGASGVIIITTKKGKTNNAVINVDMKWGVNSKALQEYDVIRDPGEYYEAYYAQLYNSYFYGQGMSDADAAAQANTQMLDDLAYNVFSYPEGESLIVGGKLNPKATLGRKVSHNGKDYWLQSDDWLDESYGTSLRQEYTVSVNGATDRSSYYASIAYLNEDGIVDYSGYERISARLKADYQARKWLKLGANVGYTSSEQELSAGSGTSLYSNNLFAYTSFMAPIYPIYVRTIDQAGNISVATDEFGNPAYDYGVAATGYGLSRPFQPTGNPLGSNRYDKYVSGGNQLNGTFTADFDITGFLKANITSTVIWGQTNVSDFRNMFYSSSASTRGSIGKTTTTSVRTNNIQTLTYYDSFGLHNVNVLAGHEYYNTSGKTLYAHALGMFSPDVPEIDAAATKDNSSSNSSRYNVEGYFLSAQYDYNKKYYVSASYRRDASSYFAKDRRWGDFWSVGAAWIISKENFMSGASGWLDELKIKASIGQQGNDNVGAYAYTNLYNLTKLNDSQMSVSFWRLGNQDITWETTTNMNVGAEFSFWKGRLSGGVDFYTKKTSDLLFWLSVPESMGSRGMYGNMGDIRNTGVELSLTGSLIRTRSVDWQISMNLSHNATRILSLPESKITDNGGFNESTGNVPMWYEVGGPLYNYYGPEYAGVDQWGQAMFYKDVTDDQGNVIAEKGTTTYNFNDATKYAHGTMLPKVFGGFGTSLLVKGFDLSVTFDYQIGGKVYDTGYKSLITPAENSQAAGQAIHKDWIRSWSPVNTDSDMPRWQYGDSYGGASSDRFLTDASYLNFQSFTVGYTLPEKLFRNKLKMRVYAAGENLWFWSARKGLDPRNAYQGPADTGVSSYSPVRTVSGGIQFTF